ncbi:hypothetical protein ACFVYG_19360 [Streptomyces sp. NPDC058256]|uniref:hypothetical protein n=1 Tax=Streptomyces sp. NPDC058256 TaxID=3346408 RepID=UPI0036E643F6
MNHFAFHIEDTAAVSAALAETGTPKPAERFTNRPFAEYPGIGPEGNWFDLSEHGFGGPHPKGGELTTGTPDTSLGRVRVPAEGSARRT